jgi:hypothetical protein
MSDRKRATTGKFKYMRDIVEQTTESCIKTGIHMSLSRKKIYYQQVYKLSCGHIKISKREGSWKDRTRTLCEQCAEEAGEYYLLW